MTSPRTGWCCCSLITTGTACGAVELEVEQGVALGEQDAELARGDLEGAGLAALAVDDAGHEALPAQAARGARPEGVARRNLECGSACAMAVESHPRSHAGTLGRQDRK